MILEITQVVHHMESELYVFSNVPLLSILQNAAESLCSVPGEYCRKPTRETHTNKCIVSGDRGQVMRCSVCHVQRAFGCLSLNCWYVSAGIS